MYSSGAAASVTGPNGETRNYGVARVGDDQFANVNGDVYRNTGDGWEKHDAGSGTSKSADREAKARGGTEKRSRSNGKPAFSKPSH